MSKIVANDYLLPDFFMYLFIVKIYIKAEEHKMLQRVPAHHGLTIGIGLWPIMDSQLIGSCPLAAMSELPSIAEQCLGKSASLHEPKECLVLQALHGNIVWVSYPYLLHL